MTDFTSQWPQLALTTPSHYLDQYRIQYLEDNTMARYRPAPDGANLDQYLRDRNRNAPTWSYHHQRQNANENDLGISDLEDLESIVNIYKAVDAWRSYRNDSTNLSSNAIRGNPAYNVHAPEFTPFQVGQDGSYRPTETHHSLRSVQNYARYPSYRVDKFYRPGHLGFSDGVPATQRSRPKAMQNDRTLTTINDNAISTSRYSFRRRRPDQTAPYSTNTVQDILPSIEQSEKITASHDKSKQHSPCRFESSRKSTPRRTVSPPPTPQATDEYLRKAELPPARRRTANKLLVILDLNGTLLVRPRHSQPQKFKRRPGVEALLDYLFDNHVVMIYTSTRPENAQAMLPSLLKLAHLQKLATVWARDRLGLSKEQYNNKVQIYKDLNRVWKDPELQSLANSNEPWNQSNTILVDDSYIKATAQPHSLLQVPEFLNNMPKSNGRELQEWRENEKAILRSLSSRLEELKWEVDVSRRIRKWQSNNSSDGAHDSAPGVVDETVDQKEKQREEQLLTPKSPESGSNASTNQISTSDLSSKHTGTANADEQEHLSENDEKHEEHDGGVPLTPESLPS